MQEPPHPHAMSSAETMLATINESDGAESGDEAFAVQETAHPRAMSSAEILLATINESDGAESDDEALAVQEAQLPLSMSSAEIMLATITDHAAPLYNQRSGRLCEIMRREKEHKRELESIQPATKTEAMRQSELDDEEARSGRGQYKVWTPHGMLVGAFGRIYDGTATSRLMPTMFSTHTTAYWLHADTTHVQRVRNAMAQIFSDGQINGIHKLTTDRHPGRPRTDQRNPPADGGPRIDQVNPPDDRRQEEGPNSLPPLDTLHFTLMWDGQKQTMRIPGDKVNRMPSMEGSFEVLQQRAEVRWKENGASLEDAYERQAVVLKPSVLRKNTAACALSPNKKTQTQTERERERERDRQTDRDRDRNRDRDRERQGEGERDRQPETGIWAAMCAILPLGSPLAMASFVTLLILHLISDAHRANIKLWHYILEKAPGNVLILAVPCFAHQMHLCTKPAWQFFKFLNDMFCTSNCLRDGNLFRDMLGHAKHIIFTELEVKYDAPRPEDKKYARSVLEFCLGHRLCEERTTLYNKQTQIQTDRDRDRDRDRQTRRQRQRQRQRQTDRQTDRMMTMIWAMLQSHRTISGN